MFRMNCRHCFLGNNFPQHSFAVAAQLRLNKFCWMSFFCCCCCLLPVGRQIRCLSPRGWFSSRFCCSVELSHHEMLATIYIAIQWLCNIWADTKFRLFNGGLNIKLQAVHEYYSLTYWNCKAKFTVRGKWDYMVIYEHNRKFCLFEVRE